jgi:competence ComEA-like helix-hairpin-helix protein
MIMHPVITCGYMRGKIALLTALFLVGIIAVADDDVLPEGKAKKIIENSCTDCHGIDEVISTPMSSQKWRDTVNTMVRRGAALTPQEVDDVVDYLSVYFAPNKVNVNTSTAKEIQAGLDISAADAETIVKYRQANGNFKDFAALQKVTGLDAKRLEEKKDQITF